MADLVAALRRYRPEEIGILASPQMSNEDLFALQRLAGQLGIRAVDHRVPPRVAGEDDDLLIRADKNPNRRGAELIGLTQGETAAILDGARQRRIKLLWIFQHDLLDSGLPVADVTAALAAAEMVVFQGPSANATSAGAHLVLPSAAYVEREGTFTNFQGRVQRFRTVVEPLGEAVADWDILGRLGRALGAAGSRAGRDPRRAGLHGARGPRSRLRGHDLPGDGRRGPRGEGMSGVALDLLLQAIPVGFVMFVVLNFGGLLTWVERKQSAIMQDRIGANRASIFGIRIASSGCSIRWPTRSRC